VTTLLERIPLDQISAEARQVRFSRVALTLVAGLLFGIGWVVAKAFGIAWLALAWSFVAVKVGFEAGRASSRPAPRH
jgi:uncharacterized membrane protein YedE/YeeE